MKSTREVVVQLRAEGFSFKGEPYVNSLIRTEALAPPEKFGNQFAWQPADVDRLRGVLRRRGRGPFTWRTSRAAEG